MKLRHQIVVHTNDSIHLINLHDIIYCKSDNSSTLIVAEGLSDVVVSKKLKQFEILLTEHGFFRIHQSFLINLQKVTRVAKNKNYSVCLQNGEFIPISIRKKKELIQLLGQHQRIQDQVIQIQI